MMHTQAVTDEYDVWGSSSALSSSKKSFSMQQRYAAANSENEFDVIAMLFFAT